MSYNITRQQALERAPLLKAWGEGAKLQYLNRIHDREDWEDCAEYGDILSDSTSEYRIKPVVESIMCCGTQVEPKKYTLPLSEIDALEITRDMWNWLSQDLNRTKHQWIKEFQPHLLWKLRNECACCSYAYQVDSMLQDCTKCPLRGHWGSTTTACNKDGADYTVWYDDKNCDIIRIRAAENIARAASKRISELTAPKAKVWRAWKPEEVPVGALVRGKNTSPNRTIILAVYQNHYVIALRESITYLCADEALNDWEHSTDNGKTWQSCGVLE